MGDMSISAQGVRPEVLAASRVVVKVGSSSLTTPEGPIDPERIRALVDTLAAVRERGTEVVLVSSGAIAAGLAPLGLEHRPRDLATQQAAASVGQGILVAHYTRRFHEHGLRVGQVLLTVDDVTRQGHYRNAYRTLARLLRFGVLPIVNENDTVATQEIRFGDNDRLAALVAHLVHAEAMVLLSDVDALYTDHPAKPGARRIAEVHSRAELASVDTSRVGSAVGTGGMRTKVEAAAIATSAGIPVVLTSADKAAEALAGEDVGTLFHPTDKRRPTRLLWLAHATEAAGDLLLDDGAVRAVVHGKSSLLPVGLTGVRGDFGSGEPVNLCAPDGRVVARGLAGYDSSDLAAMAGRNSTQLRTEWGSDHEGAAVHRDFLIVLEGAADGSASLPR